MDSQSSDQSHQTTTDFDAAMQNLSAYDSIMNLNILQSMNIALNESVPPLEIVNTLSNSYRGYAKMVQSVVEALQKVDAVGKSNPTNISSSIPNNKNDDEFDINQIICESLVEIVKEKFNKTSFDELINKFSEMPLWLTGLIEDPIFRKMLIDLYDQNRSSTLLGVCLREISARGHHR
jgi:dihydroorotate dehydrogenase